MLDVLKVVVVFIYQFLLDFIDVLELLFVSIDDYFFLKSNMLDKIIVEIIIVEVKGFDDYI